MHWNWTVPSRSISGFAGNRSPSSEYAVLGELFKVPLERLLVHEDGSVAYHRIFDDSLPYEIAYLVQDKDDFSAKRRHVARADTFAGTCYSGIFNLPQECPHSKAPHN